MRYLLAFLVGIVMIFLLLHGPYQHCRQANQAALLMVAMEDQAFRCYTEQVLPMLPHGIEERKKKIENSREEDPCSLWIDIAQRARVHWEQATQQCL